MSTKLSALAFLVFLLTGLVFTQQELFGGSPGTAAAEDRPPAPGTSSGLDAALALIGLPGVAGGRGDESTYDRARQMGNEPRLSSAEPYRRNPDGSYGSQSSSEWNSGNAADRLLNMALSAGGGWFSSWAEGF